MARQTGFLKLCTVSLAFAPALCGAFLPDLFAGIHSPRASHHTGSRSSFHARDQDPNGTTFLWLQDDVYSGKTFFDDFTFFTADDPTHGLVTYVNQSYAAANNLTGVTSTGKVWMKGDDTSKLPSGQNRDSVRIQSNKLYNSGNLFILDVDRAPWGCGVWPAWWTTGDNWPYQGEIDIIEGVHDNEHNQVTWHTSPLGEGCNLTWANTSTNFTGTPVSVNNAPHLQCNASLDTNSGCGVIEWSQASYGPYFEQQGGGVYAMKWDENSIAIWTFYRSAVPPDITAGNPDPSGWTTPVAVLEPQSCNITEYFNNHRIIFDITFCGDWAGNTYSTTTCPGTCPDRLMDPSNFVNASWIINSMIVYRKQAFKAPVAKSGGRAVALFAHWASVPLVAGILAGFSVYA